MHPYKQGKSIDAERKALLLELQQAKNQLEELATHAHVEEELATLQVLVSCFANLSVTKNLLIIEVSCTLTISIRYTVLSLSQEANRRLQEESAETEERWQQERAAASKMDAELQHLRTANEQIAADLQASPWALFMTKDLFTTDYN